MSDPNYPLTGGDGGADDLPRTLRRERDAREREAREREAAAAAAAMHGAQPGLQSVPPQPSITVPQSYGPAEANYMSASDEPLPAAVRRLDVPFFHLMRFFFKAVFAAIPALLLLGVILWGIGAALQTYFPQLVKMQILVWFPK